MPEPTPDEVVTLLTNAANGDEDAAAELLPQVYSALHALARRQMSREPAGHTLQPTALVNEAYIRLIGDKETGWNGRGHFFAAAAESMRRILIERARRVRRIKHGGGRRRVGLEHADDDAALGDEGATDLIALDDALTALQAHDKRAAEIVMLRYFAGLSSADTASALDISERTVRREWSYARMWLYRRMTGEQDTNPES